MQALVIKNNVYGVKMNEIRNDEIYLILCKLILYSILTKEILSKVKLL